MGSIVWPCSRYKQKPPLGFLEIQPCYNLEYMESKKVGVGFGVMILRNGTILLGQRHSDPVKADSELQGEGTWTMPGGKLDYGESFEEGAKREVLEETGLDISVSDLKVISLSNDIGANAHFVTVGLLLKTDLVGEAKVMEPDEITQWKWFDLDNLPDPLFFPSKKILDHYASGEFYTN